MTKIFDSASGDRTDKGQESFSIVIKVTQAGKGVGECGGNLSTYCLLSSVLPVLYALTYPILKVIIIVPFYESDLSKSPTTSVKGSFKHTWLQSLGS